MEEGPRLAGTIAARNVRGAQATAGRSTLYWALEDDDPPTLAGTAAAADDG